MVICFMDVLYFTVAAAIHNALADFMKLTFCGWVVHRGSLNLDEKMK